MTAATITDLDRMTATWHCTRLMHEYAHRLDSGLGSTAAELFTEDGEWTSPTIRSHGRADLAAYFARRDAMTERVTRHVVTNVSVELTAPDRATGRSVAIEYRGTRAADGGDEPATSTAPAIVGDYLDEFYRVDGVWLFHRRAVIVAFKRADEVYIAPVDGAGGGR